MEATRFHRLVEELVDPIDSEDRSALERLDAFLNKHLGEARRAFLDGSSAFPADELAAFLSGPLGLELTPADQGGQLDWARAARITASLSAHHLGFTLCLGGTVLGALPVLVAGRPEQRGTFFSA